MIYKGLLGSIGLFLCGRMRSDHGPHITFPSRTVRSRREADGCHRYSLIVVRWIRGGLLLGKNERSVTESDKQQLRH